MGLQEGGPRCALPSLGRGLDAVFQEDALDGVPADLVAEGPKRPLEPGVAPGDVLFGHPNDERGDPIPRPRTPGPPLGRLALRPSNEAAVPSQHRVRGDHDRVLGELLPAECVPPDEHHESQRERVRLHGSDRPSCSPSGQAAFAVPFEGRKDIGRVSARDGVELLRDAVRGPIGHAPVGTSCTHYPRNRGVLRPLPPRPQPRRQAFSRPLPSSCCTTTCRATTTSYDLWQRRVCSVRTRRCWSGALGVSGLTRSPRSPRSPAATGAAARPVRGEQARVVVALRPTGSGSIEVADFARQFDSTCRLRGRSRRGFRRSPAPGAALRTGQRFERSPDGRSRPAGPTATAVGPDNRPLNGAEIPLQISEFHGSGSSGPSQVSSVE